VVSYPDVLLHKKKMGQRVAIIGAGGIGVDVAEYLTHGETCSSLNRDEFLKEWGVDPSYQLPGGISPKGSEFASSWREVYLLQRKATKIGGTLGKTTGWIHRLTLKHRNVCMMGGVTYRKIDDQGLTINAAGTDRLLEVDNVVVCAGQDPLRNLYEELNTGGVPVHLIGGADKAVELDAKRAIDQGARLAAII
jgi:2,4-dienoyl-CoA reductase (NADPH2)